jgi:hypothetical protein
MATARETLQATLSDTEYGALKLLAESPDALSGRKVATALGVSPTTANDALSKLLEAGFATSRKSGRATMWQVAVSNPSISAWLEEVTSTEQTPSPGSSPYSTGGGGVRLEHSYAACLIASFLAGEAITELGDTLSVDSIRLQANDESEADDLLIEGRDANQLMHRSSIAVRRSPTLVSSDSASVPLFRDFLSVVTDHWSEASAGHWKVVLAVSSNANAVTQLSELAELARSLPGADELVGRLTQPGRTSAGVRDRYAHIKRLVEQASGGLSSTEGLSVEELTWRLLSSLTVRSLRLERTDRADRTAAVNTLKSLLPHGTTAAADSLFSRIEELVGAWAPQAVVLTQSVIRRRLADHPLSRSARFATAWGVLDRLGVSLRDSIPPALRSDSQHLELDRADERSGLAEQARVVGASVGVLVVTGDPDVGKSALSLRAAEDLAEAGATVASLSLRDLPYAISDLENQWGGFTVDEVLASGEVRPCRLLLVDGAEAILEGKGQTFRSISAAALRAGIGVIAVTRTDGSRLVRDELVRAAELAGSSIPPAEHVVAPLTRAERHILTSTFTALVRLEADQRASWVLGRPGLVDALLRTGAVLDPTEFLCEADVFSAVWRNLIRRDEIVSPGTTAPDDREHVALNVARRTLGLPAEPSHGTAAAELRSDGVLRVPNNPATAAGDEFASDLLRDFALCRLFIANRWEPLTRAEAPRWSIRAARLGCQAALLEADRHAAWARLSTTFGGIANSQGGRWLEVPYEALLTIGHAEAAIRDLWADLMQNNHSGLATLLRLAEGRYVSGTVGDAFALAPLVRLTFSEHPDLSGGARLGSRTLHEIVQDLVLAWLRGMSNSHLEPDPLRQEVRDVILDGDPPLYDDFTIEALASLGPDLDDRAETWLRRVADDRPGSLNPAMESPTVAISMSQSKPRLLLDLAEAYYIEKPEPPSRWGRGHSLDDGIRDFNHGFGFGFGAPQAAWYYGPFFRLLNTTPAEAISFINRMLDHAATFRVAKMSSYGGPSADEPEGVRLALLDQGPRLFVGDGHVWAWYRGTSVGPYACMSALLALERFVDHLLENLDIPIRSIADLLIRDCNNLAVPALLVGFLTRHPNQAGTLLDPFLASPDVWHLESARVSGDYSFRVRDADADKLTGADRRRFTFHETVGSMVVNARVAGNDERLAQLQAIGTRLIEAARAELTGSGADNADDYIAMVESWSEEFRFENYRASRGDDGVIVQFERPERIAEVLAPRDAELQTTNTLYGLQNRYGRYNDEPQSWPVDDLHEDLATARSIDDSNEVPDGMPWPENALVAVAAAAVRAHALGLAEIEPEHLSWAVEAVLWAAENPQIDGMSYYGSMFPMGADRAAAASAPLLLLAPFDGMDLDHRRVETCLNLLATSLYDEVRAIYAQGCEPLWTIPCEGGDGGPCRRHKAAWVSATAGLADCRLGPWSSDAQRRVPDPLPAPFQESLPTVADDALMVDRLRMPFMCMVDARNVACLHGPVSTLWSPLWDAHRRGLAHWWTEGYDHQAHVAHEPIGRRMVAVALGGDRDVIQAHIEHFASESRALHQLFEGFATAFTYDDDLRADIADFWPWALGVALDAIGDGSALHSQHHWVDYMIAALLPTPSPRSSDPDIDGTLRRCRENWLQPEALDGLADGWLRLARWEPKAVDAVIKFARSAPQSWQSTTALNWIESIVDGRFDLIANHLWYLEEWIGDLRKTSAIDADARNQYHRIVDGLASAGDRAAIRLQQLDE